ncbi:MAG: hypothetical protein PHO67_08770 [Candidatus Omnitrophica bacterium]|nr:hypothetical protein [Candidatus Omnitrophota bacterium]
MSEEEKKAPEDSYVSSFEEMFDSYGEGWTLSIYRESPKDLSGFLEEIELEPGENPVNLQYLINQWGGKVLRLMLRDNKGVFRRRMLLQLKSFPPKVYGKLINDPNLGGEQKKDPKSELLEYFALLKEIKPETPIAPTENRTLEILIPMIMPLIKAFAERALTPPQSSPSQAASIADMMTALSQMRDFVQPPSENNDMGASLIGLAEKALPLIAQKQAQAAPVQRPPVPIVAAHPNIVPNPSVAPPPPPTSQFVEPTDEQLMEILQKKLLSGDIGGEALTNLYFDTVSRLPDTERAKAERVLENALDLEPLDEPEDATPQIPGGPAGADERNDTAHRPGNKKSR